MVYRLKLSVVAAASVMLFSWQASAAVYSISDATALGSFVLSNGDVVNIANPIAATSNISPVANKTTAFTVNGGGHLLRGADTYAGFAFKNNITGNADIGQGTLSFNNMNMTNFRNDCGGALYASGQTWGMSANWVTIPNQVNINNSAFTDNTAGTYGGALYINYSSPNNSGETRKNPDAVVTLNNVSFTGNSSSSQGGAVGLSFNAMDLATVNITNGSFTNNTGGGLGGGALYVSQAAKVSAMQMTVDGTSFVGNSVRGNGGAIYVSTPTSTSTSTSTAFTGAIKNATFTNNSATGLGGAIYASLNTGKTLTIDNSTFTNNSGTAGVYITGNTNSKVFINNSSFSDHTGRALYLGGKNNFYASINNTSFTGNQSTSRGGAVYLDDWDALVGTFVDSSFTENQGSMGGAIAVFEADANIIALSKDSVFKDNIATSGKGNDFYFRIDNVDTVLNLNAGGSYKVEFNGGITAEANKKQYAFININMPYNYVNVAANTVAAPTNGTVLFNAAVENTNITMYGGTMALGVSGDLSSSDLDVRAGTIRLTNGAVNNYSVNALSLTNNADIAVDVDLAAGTMDKLTATTLSGSGNLTVRNMVLLSDAIADTTVINFADDGLKGHIVNGVGQLSYSPLYVYDVSYDNAVGDFTFIRKSSGGIPVPNPYVYSEVLSSQSVGFIQDAIMTGVMSDLGRFDSVFGGGMSSGDTPIKRNLWVKMSAFSDDVAFDDFENINSDYFFLTAGLTSGDVKIANFDTRYSFFAGYVDNVQKYTNVKTYQKGGYFGGLIEFDNGGLSLGIGFDIGFLNNESENMFGKDKYNTYWGGLAGKIGYDVELENGITVTPILYAAFSYAHSNDYTAASGMRISTDDMKIWKIAPALSVAKKIADEWKVAVNVKYIFPWYYGGDGQVGPLFISALSSDPYVEYGAGIERKFTDTWGLSLRINRRDGGRQGWNGILYLNFAF